LRKERDRVCDEARILKLVISLIEDERNAAKEQRYHFTNQGGFKEMKKNCLLLSIAVIVTGILLLSVTAANAADQQVVKVGKKGDIVFEQPTQVGDTTLPPGHYVFQHRVSGDQHIVKFVGAKEMRHGGSSMTTPMHVGPTTTEEIKCRLEPMSAKAKLTAVTFNTEGGASRVTRIEIAGENVAHVF
jgi:hypothetical protein